MQLKISWCGLAETVNDKAVRMLCQPIEIAFFVVNEMDHLAVLSNATEWRFLLDGTHQLNTLGQVELRQIGHRNGTMAVRADYQCRQTSKR